MVETLAKWMAASDKWKKNKDGMGVTVKRFSKKDDQFHFELEVPESYVRFIPKLQSLLTDICEQGEKYMVSSISLSYVAEEDYEEHMQEIMKMYAENRGKLLKLLIDEGIEAFTDSYQEKLGTLRLRYLIKNLKKEEDLWKLPDGSVSEDGLIWLDKNGMVYYNYYNEIAVSEREATA